MREATLSGAATLPSLHHASPAAVAMLVRSTSFLGERASIPSSILAMHTNCDYTTCLHTAGLYQSFNGAGLTAQNAEMAPFTRWEFPLFLTPNLSGHAVPGTLSSCREGLSVNSNMDAEIGASYCSCSCYARSTVGDMTCGVWMGSITLSGCSIYAT